MAGPPSLSKLANVFPHTDYEVSTYISTGLIIYLLSLGGGGGPYLNREILVTRLQKSDQTMTNSTYSSEQDPREFQ